jgi:uncharacterized protein
MSSALTCLWADLPAGSQKSYFLEVAESYTGIIIRLPFMVWKGKEEGKTLCVTAAVHGDEINGTGTIRQMIASPTFELKAGTLVLVPVVNIQGFERQSRYMPDRRDLNRYFPGNRNGSVTSRLAGVLFEDILVHCDFSIDLHTAAVRRTNFPHIRSDMNNPRCSDMAKAFGVEIVINGEGPEGSLRREATQAGCATIVLEAGEVWKVETAYVETATRGITNVMKMLEMIEGEIDTPEHQLICHNTRWLRAQSGGFLQFHASPGDTLTKGQTITTNTGVLGNELATLEAPCRGVIIGMSTMPAVSPGDPVIHLATTDREDFKAMEAYIDSIDDESLEGRIRDDFATNVHVVESEESDRVES